MPRVSLTNAHLDKRRHVHDIEALRQQEVCNTTQNKKRTHAKAGWLKEVEEGQGQSEDEQTENAIR